MGALHGFRGLNELQEKHCHGQPFLYPSPYGSSNIMTEAAANGDMDIPFQQQSNQIMFNMKHFLHPQEQTSVFDHSQFWRTEFSDLNERNFTPPLLSYCDVALDRWPHGQTVPRDVSPDGYCTGGRSAMEQESTSGSSAWSDRTSEGRHEHTWNSQRGSIGSHMDSGFSPSVSQDGSFNIPSSGSCIALRDVQEYPDAGSEDSYRKPEIQDLDSASYFTEAPAPYQSRVESVHFLHDDEGIGSIRDTSMAASPKEDTEVDDAIMEDDVKEQGGDSDVSDYTPTTTKRTSARRTSRPKLPASPTTTKRPPRSKPSTVNRSSKITKRPSKSSSSPTSPTVPFNSTSKTKTPCPQCPHSLPSASALTKHICTTHTRPFTCPFARYACPATFGSKNEWKRHVSSQHLRLGIYRCDIGACVPRTNHVHRRKSSSASNASKRNEEAPGSSHNDFNRKDLFTQHIRRMHGPSNAKDTAAFDATLESIRERCWMRLREPPPRSSCGYCLSSSPSLTTNNQNHNHQQQPLTFTGPTSWDERMEHVARHLEQGTAAEPEREDIALRDWMLAQGLLQRVGSGWRVVGVGGRRRRGASGVMGEVDADGEEDAVGEDE